MFRRLILALLILFALLLSACGGGNPPQYCDPASLNSPILTYPPDGGQFVAGQDMLTWHYADPTCVPEGYQIEVDTTNNFSGSVLGATSTLPNSSGWPLPIQQGTTYYWHVRAFVGSDYGPWSTVKSFNGVPACDQADLLAPEPTFPANGSTFAWADPNFQWTYPDPNCAPRGYHLQLSDDPAFSSTNLDVNLSDPAMHYESNTGVPDCTVYYWRVAGTDGGVDGPFSDPISFRVNVGNNCPPLPCEPTGLIPPNAMSPSGYEIVSSLTPSLEWEYPLYCEPDGFVIRLAPQFDLSGQPLLGGFGLTDSWTVGTPLEIATRYWWDVAAIQPPALGNFSQKETFFTGPECQAFGDMLGPPELLSPADGAVVPTTMPWLNWNPGPSVGCIPDGWTVDLQTDPNFGGTNLLGTFMYPGTIVIVDPLQDCTDHFWRVAPVQNGFEGAWSPTWNFFTNEAGNCARSLIPEIPYLDAIRDLGCFIGPNPEVFAVSGYLLAGESAAIVAQNLPGTWWVIQNPDGLPGDYCYVPKDGTETDVDPNEIPKWNDPEFGEVPSGPSCSDYGDPESCKAAGCFWYSKLIAAPAFACYSDPP